MAKEKKAKGFGVKKVENKYVCTECQHEIPIHKDCPVCKSHIDWDRYFEELKVR